MAAISEARRSDRIDPETDAYYAANVETMIDSLETVLSNARDVASDISDVPAQARRLYIALTMCEEAVNDVLSRVQHLR